MDYECRLLATKDETPDVRTFRLTRPEGLSFISGQYCLVTYPGAEGKKPFTFSSSPTNKEFFELTIKRMGLFTQGLFSLPDGEVLNVAGPLGRALNFDKSISSDVVFLAGGSGITPFMSALRYAVELRLRNRFYLFYGNQTERDIIYADELKHMGEEYSNVVVVNTLSQPGPGWNGKKGFISTDMLQEYIKSPMDYLWYMCGPPAMNTAMKTILSGLGVDTSSIKIDPWELPGKTGVRE